jgi:hypothetical protein
MAYTLFQIPNPGGHPDPRREVSPASPNPEDFDMNTVPNEWRTWLYHYRDACPTEQEISDADTQRQVLVCMLCIYIYIFMHMYVYVYIYE